MLSGIMKIDYDPDADAMNINLKKGDVAKTVKLEDNVLVDLDKSGEILTIEILFVKERNPEILKAFKIKEAISA